MDSVGIGQAAEGLIEQDVGRTDAVAVAAAVPSNRDQRLDGMRSCAVRSAVSSIASRRLHKTGAGLKAGSHDDPQPEG